MLFAGILFSIRGKTCLADILRNICAHTFFSASLLTSAAKMSSQGINFAQCLASLRFSSLLPVSLTCMRFGLCSMFVLLKGRSVKESFQIGREIASAVTAINPDPVTLKLEKVYHPCFLLTKKRYVGYSYESADQIEPMFDAKGIETVRRDTCGAVAKIMEQSLRLFFEHEDISEVEIDMFFCPFFNQCD